MILGLNVDVLKVTNTPLQLLIVAIVLAIIAAVGLLLFTTLGAPFVDKKWPADEPLNPIEMLWGESGGYIQRTFRGLPLDTAKDLASQFIETTYKAGETIVQQGEPATHFFMIKEGEVEFSQRSEVNGAVRDDVINQLGPGQYFGEVAILRRSARTATGRALTDCTILEMSAEDFVAGAALSEAENNSLLDRAEDYLKRDRERVETRQGGTGIGFLRQPAVATASGFQATHAVPPDGLSAWTEPDPSQAPSAQLAGGVAVAVTEQRGVWAHVRAENGWEGWVDGRALVARTG